MTQVEKLAAFAAGASYDGLSSDVRRALKTRVLDSLGCAIAALDAQPVTAVGALVSVFGGEPLATMIGGGRTAPDRAALYNGALVRSLDFNDSFVALGETCHPSDNLAAVLAAAEYGDRSGRDLLAALAAAYQVQCRLCEVAPVRECSFDHSTHTAYAAAAGVARALGLDPVRTAHAVAICGSGNNPLRVIRTGTLSHWTGLASASSAAAALLAAFLASEGVTGPAEVLEGRFGFQEAIAGAFDVDWEREDCEAVLRTSLKHYDADIHAQSAIEAVIELRRFHGLRHADVDRIEVDTFKVAWDSIGGGVAGPKHKVRTREEADSSLPYLLTVAMIDGFVGPEQFDIPRITAPDVQEFIGRVAVVHDPQLDARFPAQLPCRVRIRMTDGTEFRAEKEEYWGHFTRPMAWDDVVEKFHQLARPFADDAQTDDLVAAVGALENVQVRDLARLLEGLRIRPTRGAPTPKRELEREGAEERP